VEIWKLKTSEFIHKLEDLLSRRRDARGIRTLVERVHDDVGGALLRVAEHVLKTFGHGTITGLMYSTVVFGVKAGKYVATSIGPGGKLDEERRQ
jgi:hypothetical protein